MRLLIRILIIFFFFSHSFLSVAQDLGKDECEVYSISMNEICNQWDGQWEGMYVASDGNCYFGSSTHSAAHGAGFHKFNPITQSHTILAEDLTLLCNEGNLPSQQGKIHSPIVEFDGWIYFATHLSNYWPEGIRCYPGAHVIGYQLKTGKFRDFGVIKDRYSIYSFINVDPERKRLYVFVSPFYDPLIEEDGAHLYSIDIESGEKNDLGQLTKGKSGASFTSFMDNKGNLWFTLWKKHIHYDNDQGNLYRFDPHLNRIKKYDNVLPHGKLINGDSVENEELGTERSWTWSQSIDGGKKALFTMGAWGGGDERLWVFDPSKNIDQGEAFEPIANIGSTFLQTALGGDRLYFVQYADLNDERTRTAETDRDFDIDSLNFDSGLHLRSISLKEGNNQGIVDHGKIVDQDGRIARFINSLAADDQGRVYMYGAFTVKSYREATFQILFNEYPGENIYKLMDRGEFFGYFDTNAN